MDSNANKVQHVTKKSSDELLRKFADEDDGGVEARKEYLSRASKRRKKRSRTLRREEGDGCESPSYYSSSTALLERRSLLAPVTRKSALLRQLGIAGTLGPRLRARDTKKNISVLAAIEQTWRKTLEGASKALLERHYNRHRRLINDMV